ncbi:DMT family transporter [Microbacterium koreense]|uniref:DMT family transporter n=1 Tax=Microbacterium koreense TaxID=323761 RepID=A0ABW2ZPY6_9MICO
MHTTPSTTRTATGAAWGLLGVLAFSFTVPLTRIAVADLPPLFVGAGRAVVAAALAASALALLRQPLPTPRQWARLAVVAGGVVVGFPLLTSFALETASASHGAVVIAVLPAATAVAAVLRGREHPPVRFWVAAGMGAVAAVVFAALHSVGPIGFVWSDLLLFGAVIAAAVGYAEGGMLARELGAWQTVSWALVLASPVMIGLTAGSATADLWTASAEAWWAFAYLGVVSMFLGFFAWYRGLAIGPMSSVSQTQLVQPVLTLCWAALLLGEHLTWQTIIGGLAVIACAAIAVRARQSPVARSVSR